MIFHKAHLAVNLLEILQIVIILVLAAWFEGTVTGI
jgi:hypothetical protein